MRIKNYVKKTMGIAALMAAGVIFAVTGTKAAGPVAINEVNFVPSWGKTRMENMIIMPLISNLKPVRKKSSAEQGIPRELRVV